MKTVNFKSNEQNLDNSENKIQDKNFEELLKKMDDLQETEEGKLKGGFVVFDGDNDANSDGTTDNCTCYQRFCGFGCKK